MRSSDVANTSPDAEARTLKSVWLASHLRQRITSRAWPVGTRLPTERALHHSFGLSLTTVRKALGALVDEGLIERRQGAGTFVLPLRDTGSGRHLRIGVLVPHDSLWFGAMLAGIREVLTSSTTSLRVLSYGYDPEKERILLAALADEPLDGLLVTPTHVAGSALPVQVSAGMPIVYVERSPAAPEARHRFSAVSCDQAGGAYDAVAHLHGLGHTRIGAVVRRGNFVTPRILTGYHEAAHDLGVSPCLLPGPTDLAGATTVVADAVRRGVSALFVFGDVEAVLLEKAADALGVRVPDDLALVSYDDEFAESAPVPLTAVAPPKTLIGRRAAEVLLDHVRRGAASPPVVEWLRPTVVVRDSCGARHVSGPRPGGGRS